MNRIVLLVLSILVSCSLPSCKLFKHGTSKKQKARALKNNALADSAVSSIRKNVVADTSDAKKELINNTAAVWGHRTMYRTFSTKAKMHYEGAGKSYDFIANIRMQKDSIIWISVSIGGLIQVARAIVTPDSFKAVVFVEKQAFQGPVSQANNFLPEGIDFYALQNLLIGDPVLQDGTATDATDFDGTWSYRFEKGSYIQQLNYNKADSTLRSNQLITQGGTDNRALTAQYGDFELAGGHQLSTTRHINIINRETHILVEMNYSNNVFDEPLSFPFSIPKNYTLK